uniref:Uncharacterized protein n=1 Tax=Anguilla anguilla TaxID=7936 RepID=A0A0E9WRC0_ANGAN
MLNVMRSIAGWMYLEKNVHSFQKVTFLFMSTSGSLFCIFVRTRGYEKQLQNKATNLYSGAHCL